VYNKSFVAGEYDTNVTGLTATSSATKTIASPSASSTTYGGLFTVVGTKSFTFENAGSFNGDILIHTASSTALGNTVTSEVTLAPTITGAGATTANAASFANINGFNGNLIVVSTVAAGGDVDDLTIAPKAASGIVIKDGEYYKVANSLKVGTTLAGATALAAGASDLPGVKGNGLVNWNTSINGAGALVIESEVNAANVAGISSQGAIALNALMSGNSVLGSQVQNLDDEASVLKASEQLRPEINNAKVQSSLGVTERVFGLVDSRLWDKNLAAMTGKSGVATGEQANGVGVWFEGIGVKGNQERRDNVDGYNTNAYGFALGGDKALDNDIRVGAALSYANSAVKSDGINAGNNTNFDTYQATLYGSKLMGSWFLNATLGLGMHQYQSKRVVFNNAVLGASDAWQYSGKVDAGYPFQVGSATLTPVGSLAYSRLSQDGYTESGVGALNVASNDIDSFKSGLGAKAMIPLASAGGFKAALLGRAIWNHEFGDVQQDTTANFVGVNTRFTTNGVNVARDGLNLGASILLSSSKKDLVQNLSVSYDADVREQYLNHTARLQARFDF
jgi:outer membrane autotransporter protein